MAEKTTKTKYHFLTGKPPVETLDFGSDAEAVAAAKKNPEVIRVQSTKTGGYIYERDEKVEEAPESTAEETGGETAPEAAPEKVKGKKVK